MLRDGNKNPAGRVVKQDLTRLRFIVNDDVSNKSVASRVNHSQPAVIESCKVAAITDVKNLAGGVVEGAVGPELEFQ